MKKDELKLLKMSDIQVREVDWLWYPYIPFGKLTIIHGDPGEGKTTFALRLAAACSTGTPLPNMDTIAPITVIYQSAEDGLDDTIKPRLIEAGADQERIINICEEEKSLHFGNADGIDEFTKPVAFFFFAFHGRRAHRERKSRYDDGGEAISDAVNAFPHGIGCKQHAVFAFLEICNGTLV